MEAFFIFKNE